jgi:hypothetical protein
MFETISQQIRMAAKNEIAPITRGATIAEFERLTERLPHRLHQLVLYILSPASFPSLENRNVILPSSGGSLAVLPWRENG